MRIVGCSGFFFASLDDLRIEPALAGEGAEDVAARAERVAGARECRDSVLAARIRAVRLEEHDRLVLDLGQEREHLRVGRAAAQPVAERHDVVGGEVSGHLLHAEEVGMHRRRHRFGDRFRIARNGRVDHTPFFHKKTISSHLSCRPY